MMKPTLLGLGVLCCLLMLAKALPQHSVGERIEAVETEQRDQQTAADKIDEHTERWRQYIEKQQQAQNQKIDDLRITMTQIKIVEYSVPFFTTIALALLGWLLKSLMERARNRDQERRKADKRIEALERFTLVHKDTVERIEELERFKIESETMRDIDEDH